MKRRPRVYRIREFAAMAGVTVRALHHYDRLGLLKPTGRSASGYRLYGDCDLVRLEQIVVPEVPRPDAEADRPAPPTGAARPGRTSQAAARAG